jgi:hypothetical protein
MHPNEETNLDDVLRHIKVGILILSAHAIQAKDPKKTWEICQSEAFGQMQDALDRF